jgi:hypothetical protein
MGSIIEIDHAINEKLAVLRALIQDDWFIKWKFFIMSKYKLKPNSLSC